MEAGELAAIAPASKVRHEEDPVDTLVESFVEA
jgi:hypothetical protein